MELVKLLAGAYQCEINAKSNGGYTPLHLAAQFSRQEVYDLLVKAYSKILIVPHNLFPLSYN